MNSLWVYGAIPPEPAGGISTFVDRMVKSGKVRVEGVIDPYPGQKGAIPARHIYPLKPGFIARARVLSYLRKVCEQRLFINASEPRSLLILRPFLGRRRAPTYLMLHHGDLQLPRNRAGRWLMKRLALGYSAIACLSEKQYSFYRCLGIPEDRLSLVDSYIPPNAVPVDETEHPLKEVLDWIGSGSGKVIVASGYAKPYYNHDWVIDALYSDPALQSARYLLCCYGPKTELLEELRHRLEASGKGRLVYGLTPAQFDYVLGKCDIYSRPTSIDSFGIALWDAAAKGLVVVASNVCARPPQALLHQAGDMKAFVSQLSGALRSQSNYHRGIQLGPDRIALERFLEVDAVRKGPVQ